VGALAEAFAGCRAAAGAEPSAAKRARQSPRLWPFPTGADALGGNAARSRGAQLVYRLLKEMRSGVVDVKTYAGRFCLVGNSVDGFSLAPDETLFAKCDLVGTLQTMPYHPRNTPRSLSPISLATSVIRRTDLSRSSRWWAIRCSLLSNTRRQPAISLPAVEPRSSANNRVEIRVR